ncbi:Ribosomal protein L25/Gln-tRNA synthetase, anti-codon-binding domain-containing protein [Thalictrum thalictroides]|uniref:Ribosomal protein L25/Gln-tRNA synthetase, anti-codon-binding domain-containing protein n=1 Tax=Thalictrum thalictroides TaxID=46969 RepID=A0A7J6URR1_THATH|nr:Ribosomal protein L25/Gln-tRNA synthetase, anti-codon-binding domain-containing protein [Thalictrum thalictroides]
MSRWWNAVVGGGGGGNGMKRAFSLYTRSSSYHTLQAIPREYTGSRLAAKDRAQGRIPAVVFFQQQNETERGKERRLLTIEKKQIKSILKSVQLPYFYSTTFELQIRAGSGSSHLLHSGTVLPIKVHKNSEGNILNVVLVWANEGTNVKVDIPVEFKGEEVATGVKKGGYLHKVRPILRYECPAEHIPPKIELDVSKLDIGDKMYEKDLAVHPSMKLVSVNERKPVCKVLGTKPEFLEPKTKKLNESEPVAA